MKTLVYAIRFLTRSKSYTLINLLGLAFSLACCIILMRYIHRELTVDNFEGKERIFIVTNEYESRQPDFGNIDGYGSKPFTDEKGKFDIRQLTSILRKFVKPSIDKEIALKAKGNAYTA